MEEVLAPIAFHGVLSVRGDKFENRGDEGNARGRDLRRAPLLARFAQTDVGRQIRDNFLLGHNILVSRHQSVANVIRD